MTLYKAETLPQISYTYEALYSEDSKGYEKLKSRLNRKMGVRNMCNRFSIFEILKTDYTCYALPFFGLYQCLRALTNKEM